MKKTMQALIFAAAFATSAHAFTVMPTYEENAIRLGESVKAAMTPISCNDSTRGDFTVDVIIKMRPNGHVSVTLAETTGSDCLNREILERVMEGSTKVAGKMIAIANGRELGFKMPITVVQERKSAADCLVPNRKSGGFIDICSQAPDLSQE